MIPLECSLDFVGVLGKPIGCPSLPNAGNKKKDPKKRKNKKNTLYKTEHRHGDNLATRFESREDLLADFGHADPQSGMGHGSRDIFTFDRSPTEVNEVVLIRSRFRIKEV
jgi:hypothetical protein